MLPIQTREAILSKLRADIRGLNSDINVGEHSVAFDIALYPAASLGEDLWMLADFITRLQSLNSIVAMQEDDVYKEKLRTLFQYNTIADVENLISSMLDAKVGNWNVARGSAVAARALVRFYGSDNTPITVAAGKRVSTRGQNSVTFTVLDGCSSAPVQFDSYSGLWYTELLCRATTGGTVGLVAENTITYLVDNVPGVIQCRNALASFGGKNAESDVDLADRAKAAWKSWSLDTTGGLQAFFRGQPGVDDAYVAGPGNPLVGRNRQMGVPTDIFVQVAPDPLSEVDVFVSTLAYPVTAREALLLPQMYAIASSFQLQGIPNYPITGETQTITYYPNKQPVIEVLSVSGTSSGNIDFEVHYDTTNMYSGSVRAHTYIDLTLDLAVATTGETITVTYNYDGVIMALQNTIDDPQYDLMSQDLLVRSGLQIDVDITAQITLLPNFSATTVQSIIQQDLLKLFAGGRASTGKWYPRYKLGQRIDYSDIYAVITNVYGVDRIDSLRIMVGGRLVTNYRNLQMSEYARLGTITWI